MDEEIHSIVKIWDFYRPRLNYSNDYIQFILLVELFFGLNIRNVCVANIRLISVQAHLFYRRYQYANDYVWYALLFFVFGFFFSFWFPPIRSNTRHSFGHFLHHSIGSIGYVFTIDLGCTLLYFWVPQNSRHISCFQYEWIVFSPQP